MSEFDHYYKNHIAEKIELDTVTIIDYYDPEKGYEYNLRYIFDKKNSSLAITGDFGEVTARNFYNMGNWETFYEHFTDDLGYFLEKVTSSSRPVHFFNTGIAKKFILNTFFEVNDEDDLDNDDYFILDGLFQNFDEKVGFRIITDEFIERFEDIEEYEIYTALNDAGRYVNGVFRLYLDAYSRAYEYLKEIENGATQNVQQENY